MITLKENVYTTVRNLKDTRELYVYKSDMEYDLDGCNYAFFKSYEELGDKFANWIDKRQSELLRDRTRQELFFSDLLNRKCPYEVYEQPFFKIGDDSYFLDFFFPELRIAIEIDGVAHKDQKDYDKKRDKKFKSIKIDTLRYTNRQISRKDIMDVINKDVLRIYESRQPKIKEDKPKKTIDLDKIIEERRYSEKNRFYQLMLSLASKIKQIPPKSSVIIKTHDTFIVSIFGNPNFRNKEYAYQNEVNEFINAIDSNDIKFGIEYVGKRDKLPWYIKESVQLLDKNAIYLKLVSAIEIDLTNI